MSYTVRVFGPGTGRSDPFGARFPVAFDQFVVEKKKHVKRKKDGLLQIKTLAYTRISGERTWNIPSAKVYYLPGKVQSYMIYEGNLR